MDKYSLVDEAMYLSRTKPGIYDPVKLDLIKSRIPAIKIRQETEKEAQQKKDETRKKAEPSPFSYKVEEAYMKTQGKRTC